jgi:hypothetical protein
MSKLIQVVLYILNFLKTKQDNLGNLYSYIEKESSTKFTQEIKACNKIHKY